MKSNEISGPLNLDCFIKSKKLTYAHSSSSRICAGSIYMQDHSKNHENWVDYDNLAKPY